ncbi:hypothetical protein [Clostridium baratii]|uniref:hypothetical protein n=1 Tax=Clostridium baratii TaxID=1561 RepID=UPI002941D1DC|nr:hypothetical protein [Clostridium baratii]
MKISIECNIENVETYTGKNGFGANITVSQLVDRKRQLLTFNTSNAEYANLLECKLQETVVLELELNQSNFGLRITDIIDIQSL